MSDGRHRASSDHSAPRSVVRGVRKFFRASRHREPAQGAGIQFALSDSGVGNKITYPDTWEAHNFSITIRGDNNSVSFAEGSRLSDCDIVVNGDHNSIEVGASSLDRVQVTCRGGVANRLVIGDGCIIRQLTVDFPDSNGEVSIGSRTTIHGKTDLAPTEGRRISVGDDCLFGSDICLWTSDWHSILDLQGNRVNPPQDISIGNHVWVCSFATILKGVSIPDNCVVAMHSVVTRRFERPHCVIGGNPAAIIRADIDWHLHMLPWEDNTAKEPEPDQRLPLLVELPGAAADPTPASTPPEAFDDLG